ncbi:MAG: hypothetical protein ACOC33_02765 [bacterium]
MEATKKEEKLILDCYRELYQNSEPKGNFDELMKTDEVNEFGEKVIPFNDYEIDEETLNNIIEKYVNKLPKNTLKYRKQLFRTTILLGCSPKTKQSASVAQ